MHIILVRLIHWIRRKIVQCEITQYRTMDNRNSLGYVSGGGLPVYLLDRNESVSILDNDGNSTVLQSELSTKTAMTRIDTQSTLSIPSGFFSTSE